MYLCYVDESGTSEVPGNTSHFVLAGFSLPIWHWRNADSEIEAVAKRYGLAGQELHTAWLLRPYLEQRLIPQFSEITRDRRRTEMERTRNAHLLALQQAGKKKTYDQMRKNYAHTRMYIHLTFDERVRLVQEIADQVGSWGFARLFAECINKVHFDASRTLRSIDEQAFEQIVSRFEQYLKRIDQNYARSYGLLVHDNNQTVALKHTNLMRDFHKQGTLWTKIEKIIETPMFVDSKLTRMIQIADLCSYALRRYLEKRETDLFLRVFPRADRLGATAVGVRHFTDLTCDCDVCRAHRS